MAHAPGAVAADLVLRAAVAADGDDVAGLLGQLGYPCDHAEATARILAVAEDRRQALLVAVERGAVRGLLALHAMYSLARGADIVRITALVVDGQARGHGIGRLLLREAEHRARLAGAARIELTSATHRTEAHAFYKACGFNESALRFLKRLGD